MRRRQLILGGLFGAVVWWVVNTISAYTRPAYHTGGAMAAVLASDDGLTNPQLTISTHPFDLAAATVMAVMAVMLVMVMSWGRGQRRAGAEHGSARWGTPTDIAPLTNRKPARNLLLTRTEKLSLDRLSKVAVQRNLNVAVIGAAGSGKSRFFIEPNLVRAQASYLVTDSKGALLASCGQALADAGHKIRVLNMVDLASSDRFNPLAYLRPGHEPEDVDLIAKNLIANTSNGRESNDPFWVRAETALISALLGVVVATYHPHEQHLGAVVDLLGRMQASFNDAEPTLSAADLVFEEAQADLDEAPSMARADVLRYGLQMYGIYKQAAGKTAASVIVTTATRLAPIHIPAVRRLISADTLDLDMVGFEPTAIFMIVSDTSKQFAWLSALAFTTFFQRGVYLADRQLNRELPIQVMCLMDEFANIGRIPDFEVVAATVRSRGISYQLVIQNIGQGKALYENGWDAILGNCDTTLFLGSADADTKKHVSDALGKQTIIVDDNSRSYGRGGSWSTSHRAQGRELLTPDEVGRLLGNEALVLIRGLPPFKSKKLPPIKPAVPYRHHALEGTSHDYRH